MANRRGLGAQLGAVGAGEAVPAEGVILVANAPRLPQAAWRFPASSLRCATPSLASRLRSGPGGSPPCWTPAISRVIVGGPGPGPGPPHGEGIYRHRRGAGERADESLLDDR